MMLQFAKSLATVSINAVVGLGVIAEAMNLFSPIVDSAVGYPVRIVVSF
jgi:hypothetical protein